MSADNSTRPYTLEVTPFTEGGRFLRLAIRMNGKMLERSDRLFRSEQDALKNGRDAVERLLKGDTQPNPPRGRR